jgi:hypothetical protein
LALPREPFRTDFWLNLIQNSRKDKPAPVIPALDLPALKLLNPRRPPEIYLTFPRQKDFPRRVGR